MREQKADLFEMIYEEGVDAICITTNGHYTTEGLAVMGGGCAGVCAKRWPDTAVRLGKCLKNFGTNQPFVIGALDANGDYVEPNLRMIKEFKFKCLIFSFPTIDNLLDGAKLSLIKQSAEELKKLVERFGLRNVVVPRPGCGIGSLNYKDVKPILEDIFDDRFTIVSFDHED
jgi:hypothetical protein